VSIRFPMLAAFTSALAVTVLATCSYHVVTGRRRVDSADAQRSADPQVLQAVADHFYWLNNGPAAAPRYARAEKLFSERGDTPNELHTKVGRLRSEGETMSFVDLSRILNEQLQNPIVQTDKKLRLWCLIAKGYTDIEIDYRATKRDWLEAQEIATELGEKQWATRASGELGLVAFLEGNPGRAARLLGDSMAWGCLRQRWIPSHREHRNFCCGAEGDALPLSMVPNHGPLTHALVER